MLSHLGARAAKGSFPRGRGLHFKGAARCGWAHPGARVAPDVAQAAPAQRGGIRHSRSARRRPGVWTRAAQGPQLAGPRAAHGGARRGPGPVRAPPGRRPRCAPRAGLLRPPSRARARAARTSLPAARGAAAVDPAATCPPAAGSAAFPAAGSASSLGRRSGPLVQLSKQGVSHSGSQSPKGDQEALMLVFGHKQLSLIILFLLSLPVPPASPPRNRPRNPPRPADLSGLCAAGGSGPFMSLRV